MEIELIEVLGRIADSLLLIGIVLAFIGGVFAMKQFK